MLRPPKLFRCDPRTRGRGTARVPGRRATSKKAGQQRWLEDTGLPRRPFRIQSALRIRKGEPGPPPGERYMPVAWGFHGGFHHWYDRPASARSRRDIERTALIHQIHERSYYGTYSAPRIYEELRETYGIRVGCKRVARLMRQAGLKGEQKRRFRRTTRPRAAERYAPDLVQRHFSADPDTLWLADVNCVPTDSASIFLRTNTILVGLNTCQNH